MDMSLKVRAITSKLVSTHISADNLVGILRALLVRYVYI